MLRAESSELAEVAREENDVRVSESKMLRRIEGPKRDGGCRRGRIKLAQ